MLLSPQLGVAQKGLPSSYSKSGCPVGHQHPVFKHQFESQLLCFQMARCSFIWESSRERPRSLDPCSHVEDLKGEPGSWFQPGPALALLPSSIILPLKKTNKIDLNRRDDPFSKLVRPARVAVQTPSECNFPPVQPSLFRTLPQQQPITDHPSA